EAGGSLPPPGGGGGGGGSLPPLGGGGGGGGSLPPLGGGGGKSDIRLLLHYLSAGAAAPTSKQRTIHACMASAKTDVNTIPMKHATDPSWPTRPAAISIRPAISVLVSEP